MPPRRAGLGAERHNPLQPPEAVPRRAPLLPRPLSARPCLLPQLPLPLLFRPVHCLDFPKNGCGRTGSGAGDLGEASGTWSIQRPLEGESGGAPPPTPAPVSACPAAAGVSGLHQSLVGDKRGHGRGGQREDEGMINLSGLVSRSQDSAPVLLGRESGEQ